jgi:cytochrome c peroxidase
MARVIRMARLRKMLVRATALLALTGTADAEIMLSTQCPASFVEREGVCRLVTPYQQYASLQHAGVGGLKTGLPAFRDGFTAQQIDLGRYLFFDPMLSANAKVSCASCHDPDQGFADGRPRSVGLDGTEISRNAPGLWNVGFLGRFFWDGRARSLEEQLHGPLYDAHEMPNTGACSALRSRTRKKGSLPITCIGHSRRSRPRWSR